MLAGFGISTPEQVESIGASLWTGSLWEVQLLTALHQEDYETVKKLVKASKNKDSSSSHELYLSVTTLFEIE